MSNVCPTCNAEVYEDLPGGLCPTCLLAAARNVSHDAIETAAMPVELRAPTLEEMRKLFPEMEVVELIGQGGMGAVYKAVERDLDRTVALKVFLYRNEDPAFAERFKREARALAKLKHNNIVGVHHIGERDGLHFMIMEYVDGLNLRQLSADQRLDPTHAMQLVPKLCDALQYAHDNGVIHRDIKPENILIDSAGEIKVADFGLAKMTGSGKRGTLTHTRQVMGTWNYMAPEQVERPTEVDHRADIYSLGVVIYEMLTGELPLGRFEPPSEKVKVNVDLDKIVMRALEKSPDRRYQQASEFKSGFESVGDYSANVAAAVAADVAAGVAANVAANAGVVAPNLANPNFTPQYANAAHAAPPVKSKTGETNEPKARFMVCIMAGREKRGRWQVGSSNNTFTLMGGTCLDLTEVDATDVVINSFVMMGGVEIIVPTGANVDLDGFILMGATENKVKSLPGPPTMNVRIRSYGMMGGCDVVSKTPKKALPPSKKNLSRQAANPTIAGGLDLIYGGFATLVSFAIPAMFILGVFRFITPQAQAVWFGVLTAMFAGMLWVGRPLFRALFKFRPDDATDDELEAIDSATTVGTLIRILALVFLFACPILFVTAAIGPKNINDGNVQAMAIGCGIVSVVLSIAAKSVEDFFYGNRI